MTKETKDIDYSVVASGPLYIPEEFKKPGFQYCFVTDQRGEVQRYERLGYEVVIDEALQVNKSTSSRGNPLGAAVVVPSKCGQTLILMAIPDELHKKYEAFKKAKNNEILKSIGYVDGIPPSNQYGNVEIDYRKFN